MMTDSPSLLQIVSMAGAVLGAMNLLFFWAVRWLLKGQNEQHAQRFTAFAKTVNERLETVAKLERELLELRAELPRDYVRREDQIRFGAVLEAKIDALREAFTRFLERAYDRS